MALPLRRQIVILNLVILVPVFAVIAWSARATYNEQLRQIAAETQAIAATIVVYLERGLDMAAVQTVIEAIPLAEGSVITITDDRSVILARSREAATYIGRATDASPVPATAVAGTVIRDGMDGIERVFGNAANVPDGTGTDPFATFTNSTNAAQFGVAQFAPGDATGHHGGRWAVHRATWTSGDPSTLVTSWAELQGYVSSGELSLVRDPGADFRCPVLGNPQPLG